MKKFHLSNYHFVYAILDILISFGVSVITFLSFYGLNQFIETAVPNLIYSAAIALLVFIAFNIFKIYRIITINIGIFESIRIMLVVFGVQIIGLICVALIPDLPTISPYIFTWMLSTTTMCFLLPLERVSVRVFNIAGIVMKHERAIRTLVVGAGASGKVFVDESRRSKDSNNKVVVIVDDDKSKIGGLFANIPVEGPISNIRSIIERLKIQEVVICISNIDHKRLREILGLLENAPVRIRRMPMLSEMEGPNDKRIIDIDVNDLLNRDPVVLNNDAINDMLSGKSVLVTGAGGSIGSELVRQIFNTHPKTLILFDIYENSTYEIQMELTRRIREEKIDDINLITLIGSTYNEFRVETIIKKYRPDYIYHAAAYKHVPLMEDSPAEAIRTNVIGTYNVAKMADKYHVKKMVLVSTDKAVRPTNVMGATKRFAETIIQYFSSNSSTKYAAVRFGNVLGSNGSVVPLFKKQIEVGGPVTITDKNIIRYFMTIPEAVSLIIQCSLFADGGEIFVLDMGKPVKIIDLAERLIRQAGLIPGTDIKIIETGLRPGEKLYEELLIDLEHQTKTDNSRIFVENKGDVNKNLEKDVAEASKAFSMEETSDVKTLLKKLISTYKISTRG